MQKLEISPQGLFTLGVKAEIEKKNLFNLPQVTNKLMLNFMALGCIIYFHKFKSEYNFHQILKYV
jgi:hypothetical protein